jgi:hypothetical protein
MIKKLTLTATLILLLSIFNMGHAQTGYTDVKAGHWAYEPIRVMSEREIIKGYPDGGFKPNNEVTYAEFIKMVVVAETGKELELAESPFHWSKNYYDKAIELEHFTKYDIMEAQLPNPIPRGDMALIMSAILGDMSIENYDEIQKGIKDIDYKTKNEYDITKVYYAGVLSGYEDQTFKPDRTLSRAESASVIHRLVDESKRTVLGKSGIKPEPAPEPQAPELKKVTLDYGYKTFEVTSEEVQLGDHGITDIYIDKDGYIEIRSTVQYETIIVYVDNKLVPGIAYANGLDYCHVDGYYIYEANPMRNNMDVRGKVPSLYLATDLSSIDHVYEYTNVTL